MTEATFSDLPIEVLEIIVQKTFLVDRLVLRNVCKDLRNLVDSTEAYCDEIVFYFWETHTVVILENGGRRFRKTVGGDFQKEIIADASAFLKNTNLKIDKILLTARSIQLLEEFLESLKSLTFKLDVRSINIWKPENRVIPILKFLKPGTLEEIQCNAEDWEDEELDEFMEAEQWKRARTYSFRLSSFEAGKL